MKSAFCESWGITCAVLKGEGIDYGFHLGVHDPLIHRGRDHLAAEFLKSGCTHLFFVDCDIMWSPVDMLTVLHSGHDVAGAAYRRKGDNHGYNVSLLKDDKRAGSVDIVDGGWLKVKELATGFLCISREALMRLAYAHPELMRVSDHPRCHGEPYFSFFHCHHEPLTLRELSEDYAFCQRWRATGGDVWCYGPAHLTHVGAKAYAGSLVGDALKRKAEREERA